MTRDSFIIAGAALFTAALVLWKKENPVGFADATEIAIDAFSNAKTSTEDTVSETVQMAKNAWQIPTNGIKYWPLIRESADRNQVPAMLLARLLYEESRFRSDIISGAVKSPKGAIGIAQFLPDTAAEMHVDPYSPASSIEGAARYLRQLYDQFGTWYLALAAYNWGQGNLTRKGIGAAPSETTHYVVTILADIAI